MKRNVFLFIKWGKAIACTDKRNTLEVWSDSC